MFSVVYIPLVHFFVQGEPKGQPRPKAFARKIGNKFHARVYDPGTAEAWKGQVAYAVREKFGHDLPSFFGPTEVELWFYFRRPKSHYRSGKFVNTLKEDAPDFHTSTPDCDNAAKAILDALVILGVIANDKLVCDLAIHKRYVTNLPNYRGATIGVVGCDVLIDFAT